MPGLPVRLVTGLRFDVLEVPAEAGDPALRHLGRLLRWPCTGSGCGCWWPRGARRSCGLRLAGVGNSRAGSHGDRRGRRQHRGSPAADPGGAAPTRLCGCATWRCTRTPRGGATPRSRRSPGFGADLRRHGAADRRLVLHGGSRVALWTAAVAIDYAGPGVADARAPARPAARRRRALRRALRPVRDHLPRRVDRRDRASAPASRRSTPSSSRRWRSPADHDRDVVDVLRPFRGHGRGAPARCTRIRCWPRPTATATCTC